MKLKVISLNIWIGGVLMDNIIDFLRSEDADIVLLQEVLQGSDDTLPVQYRSFDTLKQKLGYPYGDFAPSMIDIFPWGDIPNGNAILSKFPIIDRDVVLFDQSLDASTPRSPFDPTSWPITPRNLQHVVLETPAADINVYNFQGVWDLDGDNISPERERMRDVILRSISGKKYVILAGDTNAKHTNPVMRALEQHLTNIFGDDLRTSFNMRRKTNPGYASAVVDMIYVSDDFQVLTKQCPDIDISDHLPLVVELKEITEEVS